jgi:hypothetical protein
VAGLEAWVDASQDYRHQPGQGLSSLLQMLRCWPLVTALSLLRWLAALDEDPGYRTSKRLTTSCGDRACWILLCGRVQFHASYCRRYRGGPSRKVPGAPWTTVAKSSVGTPLSRLSGPPAQCCKVTCCLSMVRANFFGSAGFANRKPCTKSKPISRTTRKSARVSTPSATVRAP